jgi:flagellar hook-length control protein FliK
VSATAARLPTAPPEATADGSAVAGAADAPSVGAAGQPAGNAAARDAPLPTAANGTGAASAVDGRAIAGEPAGADPTVPDAPISPAASSAAPGAASPLAATTPHEHVVQATTPEGTPATRADDASDVPLDDATDTVVSSGAATSTEPAATAAAGAPDVARHDDCAPSGGDHDRGAALAGAASHGAHHADAPVAPHHTEAVAPPQSTEPADAQPTPWRQVADALREVRRDRDGSHSLTVRLDPPELGTVDVQVHVRDGRISVHASAHTDATRELLTRSLPDLRHALESHGLQTGSLDVGAHPHAQSGASSDSGGGTGGDGRHTSSGPGTARDRAPDATPRRSAAGATTGRLDVRL